MRRHVFPSSISPVFLMNDDELIYKKLSGELTSEETLFFEHRRAMDPSFEKEYDFQRSAVEALAQSDEAMKAKLQRAYRAVRERKQQRRKRSWAAAAVIALLVGAGAIIWFVGYPVAPLYEQHYILYQPYPEMRGGPADTVSAEEIYADALSYYQRGDYAAAATVFQTLPSDAQRDLYLGNCYWQLGDVATAQSYFKAAQAEGDTILRQHATWYLVLCYLRQGDTDRVQQELEKILNRQGLYYKEAQQLQSELVNS